MPLATVQEEFPLGSMAQSSLLEVWIRHELSHVQVVTANYALERSVTGLLLGAASAPEILAPAAPGCCLAQPAQRGRSTISPEAPLRIPVNRRGMNQWRRAIFHGT